MDSGNSGSFQSSSGGDDEYDSRADALHPFLHSSSAAAAAVLPPPQPPPPPPPPPLFDPLSYLTSFPRSSASSLLSPTLTAAAPPAPLPSDPPPPPPQPRGSKKRSRASRRAPTTVLTTDTSNFRAMVQEFTGIPSPPFAAAASSAASHFTRPRLDLSATPPYLLRPFPHKLQSQSLPLNPITPPSTLLFSSNSNTNTSCSTTSSSSRRSSGNYQLPCDAGLGSHTQTLMPMQNPTFPFQSLRLSAALPAFLSAPPSISLSQSELGGDLQSLVRWAGDQRGDSRPELHGEKGTDSATTAARGESAVDSWICSSD